MSDPADLLAPAGGGLAGAGVIAALVRYLIGGAIADLKEKLSEFRADTREQINGLKETINRNDDRHDKAIEGLTQLTMKVNALHQRLDTSDHAIRELERRLDREGR